MPRSVSIVSFAFLFLLLWLVPHVGANNTLEICPSVGIQPWSSDFEPDGIILTAFDGSGMWVYNVANNQRYPLPDTHPCGTNCRLSRDATWITYVNAQNDTYGKMRLDGTERTLLAEYAADVEWWSDDKLLIWTPGHTAYLRLENGTDREYIDVDGIVSVQPYGHWGVLIEQDGDNFKRTLVNLDMRGLQGVAEQRVDLGGTIPYFDAASWSPDGQWLAYVSQVGFDTNANTAGAEIFAIHPGDVAPTQLTDLNGLYGAVRINGRTMGELSWSPDSTHIAFWVIELTGPSPEGDIGNAVIHVLDVNTQQLSVYCGFSTSEHTPNPSRLIWSPDGTHIAFGGNIPGDERGYLLLALDAATGVFTELSEGIFPALGSPDPIAWGYVPR